AGAMGSGHAALEQVAIPVCERGGRVVGALKELSERAGRLPGAPYILIEQDEFAQPLIIVGRPRPHRGLLEVGRLGIHVGVERRLAQRHAGRRRISRPEATGHVLLILGELQESGPALWRGGRTAGEPRLVEVERPPEELDWTTLADEGGAVLLQDPF